jgi:hypothetical protein
MPDTDRLGSRFVVSPSGLGIIIIIIIIIGGAVLSP